MLRGVRATGAAKLHPEKTRLVDYRRPGGRNGTDSGSFDFLGFTHYWGRSRKGAWAPMRETSKSRFGRALRALGVWMASVRHHPVAKQAVVLRKKLQGHFEYYGLRGSSAAIDRFRYEAIRLWQKWLARRSPRARLNWDAFNRLLNHHPLPPARLNPAWRQPLLPFANP